MDLGDTLRERGLTVAVAESLTGGLLANRLARIPGASDWFLGGVVAYARDVKHDVLSVRPGPVVSEGAALDMAAGAADLLGADVAVAVTGVGGPDPQDGIDPGTVWMAVRHPGGRLARLHRFLGDPEAVCESTCEAALSLLLEVLTAPGAGDAVPGRPASR